MCGIFVFMTTPETEGSGESGIWYGSTSARNSEVARVAAAVHNLGNMTLRVIEDPDEARDVVFDLKAANLRQKYPNASTADLDRYAAAEADRFVADMEPSTRNNQDPLRLIRIESTDGSPVLPHKITEEIKFRIGPGLAHSPITVDEVLYTTLHPTDPSALLD